MVMQSLNCAILFALLPDTESVFIHPERRICTAYSMTRTNPPLLHPAN